MLTTQQQFPPQSPNARLTRTIVNGDSEVGACLYVCSASEVGPEQTRRHGGVSGFRRRRLLRDECAADNISYGCARFVLKRSINN